MDISGKDYSNILLAMTFISDGKSINNDGN